MAKEILTKNYTDLDLVFSPNPITKDISLKHDVEAVKRSIQHLLFTNKGERLFQPNLYSGIKNILFENYNSLSAVTIKNKIEDVLSNHEPRINSLNINFYENPETHYLQIDISFKVKNSPATGNISFDIQRLR